MSIKTFMMTCGRAMRLLAQPVVAGPLEDGMTAYDSMSIETTRMMTCGPAVRLPDWSEMAEEFEDAKAAYDRGDYAIALELLRPLAELGDARAQTNLGFMHAEGRGVTQDYVEAMKWELGAMYDYGLGVQRHDFTAIKWYRKAAEQNDADAQCSLGNAYVALGFEFITGGDLRDFIEAMKWYHLAADQGNTSAQFNLGSMYSNGEGVPQDYVKAHMWWNLAAAGYPPSETQNRDGAAENRDTVATKMTPEQIAEAQRLAREWLAAHPKP